VLGLNVERRLPEIGLVQLRAGSAMIDLVPQKEGEAPERNTDRRNMDHYAVQIESMDVAALSAHLRRHGVDPGEVRRRYGAEGYGSSIYITDPDGNTVELKGPPEPGQTIPGGSGQLVAGWRWLISSRALSSAGSQPRAPRSISLPA